MVLLAFYREVRFNQMIPMVARSYREFVDLREEHQAQVMDALSDAVLHTLSIPCAADCRFYVATTFKPQAPQRGAQ